MGVPLRTTLGTIGLAAPLWLAEPAGAALGQSFPPKPTSAGFESPAAAWVDQAVLALRESGVCYRLHRRWFGGED